MLLVAIFVNFYLSQVEYNMQFPSANGKQARVAEEILSNNAVQ
jgi:hypothetical protein